MDSDLIEVQRSFLEGTKEIYENMMSEDIFIYFMSEDTEVNVYGESVGKKYKEAIPLWGKISVTRGSGETDFEKNICRASVVVPTKDLIDKGIDYSPQNYDVIKQAILSYQGVLYQIEEISPLTNVANVFLFHRFDCSEVKEDYLSKEVVDNEYESN